MAARDGAAEMRDKSGLLPLVTGACIGALMKASAEDGFLAAEVMPEIDGDGNYLPEIHVRGRESGDRVVIRLAYEEDE